MSGWEGESGGAVGVGGDMVGEQLEEMGRAGEMSRREGNQPAIGMTKVSVGGVENARMGNASEDEVECE